MDSIVPLVVVAVPAAVLVVVLHPEGVALVDDFPGALFDPVDSGHVVLIKVPVVGLCCVSVRVDIGP